MTSPLPKVEADVPRGRTRILFGDFLSDNQALGFRGLGVGIFQPARGGGSVLLWEEEGEILKSPRGRGMWRGTDLGRDARLAACWLCELGEVGSPL